MSARASPYPVGPASYAARVGPGNLARNSTALAVSPDSLLERISPDSASNVTVSTLRACTSRPAQLRTFAMVGSSMWLWSAARGCHPHGFKTPHHHVGGRPTPSGQPDNLHMV